MSLVSYTIQILLGVLLSLTYFLSASYLKKSNLTFNYNTAPAIHKRSAQWELKICPCRDDLKFQDCSLTLTQVSLWLYWFDMTFLWHWHTQDEWSLTHWISQKREAAPLTSTRTLHWYALYIVHLLTRGMLEMLYLNVGPIKIKAKGRLYRKNNTRKEAALIKR